MSTYPDSISDTGIFNLSLFLKKEIEERFFENILLSQPTIKVI
jgi:hypothetical protein